MRCCWTHRSNRRASVIFCFNNAHNHRRRSFLTTTKSASPAPHATAQLVSVTREANGIVTKPKIPAAMLKYAMATAAIKINSNARKDAARTLMAQPPCPAAIFTRKSGSRGALVETT